MACDRTIPIVLPRDPAMAEIPSKLRGLTLSGVLSGEETLRRTVSADNNHRLTTVADSSRQKEVEAGSKEGSIERWPPIYGGRHLRTR